MPPGVQKSAKFKSPALETAGRHESVATLGRFATGTGIEAAHWSSVGAVNAADAEIMAYALIHDCVVLTHDLDFGAILAATQGKKPSVVQLRADDVNPDLIGQKVLVALRQMQAELHAGALVTVDPNRTRLRVLPLHRQTKSHLES